VWVENGVWERAVGVCFVGEESGDAEVAARVQARVSKREKALESSWRVGLVFS
jgi:hypothetical protein